MGKLELPACPYCSKKTNWLNYYSVMKKSSYRCKFCKKKSVVTVSRNIFNLIKIYFLLFISVLFAFLVLGKEYFHVLIRVMIFLSVAFLLMFPLCAKLVKKVCTETK